MFKRTARNEWSPAASRSVGLWLIVAASLLAMGCVQVQAADGSFVMGRSIVIEKGETARDDVVAVGGNVRIDGRARRDVVVIGGRLEINGVVDRSVSCVGGTLVLGPGAHIGGDVVLVGGRLIRDDSARIDGEFVNVSIGFPLQEWLGPMHWGWDGWWGFTPFAWIARTTQLFYWLLLALLTVAVVGDRVSSASHAISREPLRIWLIGVVGWFALLFAFCIFVLLSFLIIGIPFLVGLIFMCWLAYIFGTVAVFQSIGSRVMNMAGRPEASQIAIVLAGALAMGIVRYVPGFGFLIWTFIVIPLGLGTVFSTRFGTGRPWVRRSSVPPPTPGGVPGAGPYQPSPPVPPAATAPTAPPMTPAEPAHQAPGEDASAGSMEFDKPADGGDLNVQDAAYDDPEADPEPDSDSDPNPDPNPAGDDGERG